MHRKALEVALIGPPYLRLVIPARRPYMRGLHRPTRPLSFRVDRPPVATAIFFT